MPAKGSAMWGSDPAVRPVTDRTCKSCGRPPKIVWRKQKKIWEVRNYCNACSKTSIRPWARHKKDKCERCGFVPENLCQLDVDHIDGDKRNNDESNLQTLCANCHRLKTWENKDHENDYADSGANTACISNNKCRTKSNETAIRSDVRPNA